ncbi:hypothetical protein F4814DRAFT_451782 [Daldinia grandis]|nr:hypothetical protein F4814DRAFT_451782 [Daldinia grandis]
MRQHGTYVTVKARLWTDSVGAGLAWSGLAWFGLVRPSERKARVCRVLASERMQQTYCGNAGGNGTPEAGRASARQHRREVSSFREGTGLQKQKGETWRSTTPGQSYTGDVIYQDKGNWGFSA